MSGSPALAAPDVALIFEGGGMRNSYTAACVSALIEHEVQVGWVGGISAGASHTVNMLSHDAERARESFVEFGAAPGTGGISSFLRGDGYFNAEFIYETSGLPGNEFPFDWDTFTADPTPFRVGAMHARTGETVYWGREDLTDLPSLMKRVRASSTMPVLMKTPVVDGEPYVDGALGSSGGIALEAAEQEGFSKFLVVCTRPRDYVKPEVKYPGAVRRVLRDTPAVAEAVITRPGRYNATKRRLLELEEQGRALLFFPEHMRISNTERKIDKLRASFTDGENQMRDDWARWEDFLTA
ncbi:patatin-like phospholipase family protein [Corynebacterium sp. AOP36-E1-14]|uniref:patatin-like phospholipase family protein n=1 Tax=unclassified Corynebacterium TaxID=2624378 RepID=UPI00403437B5